jgi:hypothetical protein
MRKISKEDREVEEEEEAFSSIFTNEELDAVVTFFQEKYLYKKRLLVNWRYVGYGDSQRLLTFTFQTKIKQQDVVLSLKMLFQQLMENSRLSFALNYSLTKVIESGNTLKLRR